MDSKTYWPFNPVPPEMRTELQDLQIQLMEESVRLGCRAYIDGSTETGVLANGRAGVIFRRGSRTCFEVIFSSGDARPASAVVDEFDCAGHAVLAWVRTGQVGEAMKYVVGHEVAVPRRTPAGG
jgi:hypothetical protein